MKAGTKRIGQWNHALEHQDLVLRKSLHCDDPEAVVNAKKRVTKAIRNALLCLSTPVTLLSRKWRRPNDRTKTHVDETSPQINVLCSAHKLRDFGLFSTLGRALQWAHCRQQRPR